MFRAQLSTGTMSMLNQFIIYYIMVLIKYFIRESRGRTCGAVEGTVVHRLKGVIEWHCHSAPLKKRRNRMSLFFRNLKLIGISTVLVSIGNLVYELIVHGMLAGISNFAAFGLWQMAIFTLNGAKAATNCFWCTAQNMPG